MEREEKGSMNRLYRSRGVAGACRSPVVETKGGGTFC